MDGNAMPASNQKKAIALDDELVELLWQNGSVTAQAQTHQRHSGRCQSLHRTSASGLTGEETAPWFPGALDHGGDHGVTLEKDLYSQLWQNIANGIGSAAMDGDILIGPGPQPTDFAHFARAPPMSGIGSSWTGEVGSSFCGSNQVPRIPVDHGENTALPSDGLHGVSTHDGTGTSSSGGSGSNFGGSGLPSMSTHGNKRKGKGRDDPHSRGEDVEYEAIEEAKSLRRSASKRRSRAAEVHNLSERRRRDRINEKMRALQELIPHCNKTDKASILDEAIEYLKSLQMQVQIMWMSTRTAPIMFPGTHQFISPMAIGVNSACMPAMQVLSQLQRVPPYMNQPLPNQLPHNSFPSVSANVANQMQNVRIGESTNPFIHLGGAQTAAPQVPSSYAYRPQVAQENEIPEVPVSTILTTSGTGPPSS